MKRILTLLTIVAAVTTASSLEVTLPAAGTLKDYITPEQQEVVTELKVTGDINGDDLRIIRHMIGAQVTMNIHVYGGIFNEVDSGACRVLDLSDANIVEGGCYTFWYEPSPKQGPPYYLPGYEVKADTIDYAMFYGSKIEELILPNSVRYIGNTVHHYGNHFFQNLYRDSSDDVTAIEVPHCIDGSRLRKVTLPAKLEHINIYGQDEVLMHRDEGPDYFGDIDQCELLLSPNLEEISIDASNENYVVIDGILYTHDCKELLLCPPKREGQITIPEETERIGFRAVAHNRIEHSLAINAKEIAREAFIGTEIFEKLSLGQDVQSIGYQAFYRCNVPEIEIYGSPNFECWEKSIPVSHYYYEDGPVYNLWPYEGSFAFAQNPSLRSIEMPEIESLPLGIFMQCSGLAEIDFRKYPKLYELGRYTFFDCPLNTILYDDSKRISHGYDIPLHRPNLKNTRSVYYPKSQIPELGDITPDDDIYLWMSEEDITDIANLSFKWGDYGVNCYYVDGRYEQGWVSMSPYQKMGSGHLFIPKGIKEKLYEALLQIKESKSLSYYNERLLAFIPYDNWIEVDMGDFPKVDISGVETIFHPANVVETARYDVSGRQLSKPLPGINIVRYSDGTVKKEFVR